MKRCFKSHKLFTTFSQDIFFQVLCSNDDGRLATLVSDRQNFHYQIIYGATNLKCCTFVIIYYDS